MHVAGQNLLGEFLRARRKELSPAEAGLRSWGTRRVPGLRREEVARLADVSPDYYVRLEQGRQVPSEQVIHALARAMRLDEIATTYLFDLARESRESGIRIRTDEAAVSALQTLVDQWTGTPAWVSSRCANILAGNTLAIELNPSYKPGCNALRDLFLHEHEKREIFVNYDECAATAVASLRARAGGHLNDSEISAYVSELQRISPAFAEIWARHEVRFHGAGIKPTLRHPLVGELEFLSESMIVNDTEGYILTVYYAEPGSETARRLSKLRASLGL
jgi:transcriptional regulator with XRE-family HTH domain